MKTLNVFPFDGLLKRFPEHRIASEKKEFCQKLQNLISLDNKIYKIWGGEKFDSTALPGSSSWAKRIYYADGNDQKRAFFAEIGRKLYKANESTRSFDQVEISNSLEISLEQSDYIDATIKVSGNVTTFLIDGKYFYKFTPNEAGNWERLPQKVDIDGITIEPTYCVEYLDRLWVICKNRNVVLCSKNLVPETFNDSTDCALIDLPSGNGGFPKALIVFRGFLYVIHEDYIAPITGSSIATFAVRPGDINYNFGTEAPLSVLNLKTTFGFLNSKDNEYYLSGGTLDSTQDQPLSYPVKISELINPYKAHQTVATLDTSINCIRLSYVPTGEGLLNSELFYSLDEKKWCGESYGRHISRYAQWNGVDDNNEMFTSHSDTGAVMWEQKTLRNYDGSAITIWLITGAYVVGKFEDVQFEEFYFDAKPSGNYNVDVKYYLDSRITTVGNNLINLQGELVGVFAIQIADQKEFMNRALFLLDRSKGRTIRFEIQYDGNDREFEFYGMYVNYNQGARLFSKYIAGA